MTWKRDLRQGIAQTLADEHPTLFAFNADGTAPNPARCGIYGVVMPDQPDEAVALNVTVAEEALETTVAVQFRYRAATEARLDAMEDAMASSYTNRSAGMLGSARLIRSRWASGASLGQDSRQRLERSANFYMVVKRPLTHQD